MKNSIVNSEIYKRLENYFRENFTEDGYSASYEEIKEATGIDIRAGRNPRQYQIFACLRDNMRLEQDPLMLEVVRGQGIQRIRIGVGAHSKCYDDLGKIRRKSDKMMDLAQVGRLHSVDDEEAYQNQTMAKIYSHIKMRTLRESIRDEFVTTSNGFTPTRPFVSLRQISKLSLA